MDGVLAGAKVGVGGLGMQWTRYNGDSEPLREGLVRTGSLPGGELPSPVPPPLLAPLLQGLGCVNPASWILWLWHLTH